jgi:hypothetical protein
MLVDENAGSNSGEDLMSISTHAVDGTSSRKTIRLRCFIQQTKAMVLVDSGSTHDFISEQFATQLPNWAPLAQPVQVKVPNGSVMLCTHKIVDCPWLVQGELFLTTFKIIPLKCYDAILGTDWLELYSPMQVKWAQK